MSRFVVHTVAGPPELAARAPLTATTLTSLADGNGHGEYWCASLEEPIKYRFPYGFDRRRCQPQFLGLDDDGAFLWTGVIVVWTQDPGARLHPGMRDLEVGIGYVIDQTLGGDRFLDPAKIDVVATARIDDADAPPPVDTPATPAAPVVHRPADHATRVASPPVEVGPPRLRPAQFGDRLALLLAKLASLTGIHPEPYAPVPAPIGDLIAAGVTGFDLYGPEGPRYRRRDPETGWQTVETGTLEELLYLVVDDVARRLAWQWSEGTPVAAAGMPDHLREDVATDYWHVLVHAMDPEWGARTSGAADGETGAEPG